MRAITFIVALPLVLLAGTGCTTLTPNFKTDLTGTMHSAKPQLSECYRQALQKNPSLSGTMALAMTVERGSTALSGVTVIERPGTDEALEACVVQAVSALNMPKAPLVTVKVEYPITLTPEQ